MKIFPGLAKELMIFQMKLEAVFDEKVKLFVIENLTNDLWLVHDSCQTALDWLKLMPALF